MDAESSAVELSTIETELARLRKKVASLNKRKKPLIESIINSMRESDQTERKFGGKLYKLEERTKRVRKSKKTIEQDILSLLDEQGIDREKATEIYQQITDSTVGSESVTFRLKVAGLSWKAERKPLAKSDSTNLFGL